MINSLWARQQRYLLRYETRHRLILQDFDIDSFFSSGYLALMDDSINNHLDVNAIGLDVPRYVVSSGMTYLKALQYPGIPLIVSGYVG